MEDNNNRATRKVLAASRTAKITIPKAFLSTLDIEIGDFIDVILEEDRIVLKKTKEEDCILLKKQKKGGGKRGNIKKRV